MSAKIEKCQHSLNNTIIKKYLLLFFIPTILHAQTLDQYQENKARLQPKIEMYAIQYGVSSEVMNFIVDHESRYNKEDVGDTYITCKRTGKPIHARGLVQITDCYWPGISDEQALDDDFALSFLASWLAKGKCRWWSTCPVPPYLAIR